MASSKGLGRGASLLVAALIVLAVAWYATHTDIWRTISTAWNIGDPDAVVDAPVLSAPEAGDSAEILATLDGLRDQVGDYLSRPGDTTTPEVSEEISTYYSQSLELLETIPTSKMLPLAGYDRTGDFGNGWQRIDGTDCDARNYALSRDLTEIIMDGSKKCQVNSGVLDDPYTGRLINFTRGAGTSAQVQIDHVVALANSWRTGAQDLTQDQRVALANDPLNLLAVDGPTNAAKGASDASQWLPPHTDNHCEYVSLQTQVKSKYDLWMTPSEKSAIEKVLEGCI